ncbi:DUF6745 domain-containing protein [Actinomycetes bacterium KLBMP 9797]
MTAPVRLRAAVPDLIRHREPALEQWFHAVEIRQEWLRHGLSTQPADRAVAEQCLTRVYARLARPRPRFVWVESPQQALSSLAGLPTHDVLHAWVRPKPPPGAPPLASDLVMIWSRLRSALDACLPIEPAPPRAEKKGKKKDWDWAAMPPADALAAGAPLRTVLRHGVREALRTSLGDGFVLPVRAALAGAAAALPVAWYGQQESSWIAYYDAVRRLGMARFPQSEEDHLEDWAGLARSCGWWWPGEQACVVVERPATVHTAPVPGAWCDEVRAHTIEYRDGWRPPLTRGKVPSRP